jgi:phosphate:Na+ symporter
MLATIITQSSSAGVAATMTALYAGAISFEQGLALIIGMDVGTTVTAMLATIGTTTSARRTGVSHIVYNLLTATVALLLISPYIATVNLIWPGALQNNAEISLVAFHSLFNIISIMLILPFAGQFAHLLIKLVPDKQPRYTFPREKALLDTPALALAEVQNSAIAAFQVLLHHIQAILMQNHQGQRADLAELQQALDETHVYLDEIHVNSAVEADYAQLLELVHVLDHLQRLHERCEEDEDRAINAGEKEELIAMHNILLLTVQKCIDAVKRQNWAALVKNSKAAHGQISAQRELRRDAVARLIADGSMDVPEASDDLEAIRWLFRVSYHIARVGLHLERAYMALATRG